MKSLNSYHLKWIAIIGMFLNHAAIVLREVLPFGFQFPMYAVGGVTFPIMAFLLVEGYRHTSNIKNYLLRIFIFGLIAQYPHTLAFGTFSPNIMFTLFLGLILLLLYDKMTKRWVFWLIFAFSLIIAIFFEWGFIGIIMILMLRTITKENNRRIWPAITAGIYNFVLAVLVLGALALLSIVPEAEKFMEEITYLTGGVRAMLPSLTFFIGCFLAALLLRKYNGQRGKSMKYFFYIFYPLHFIILAILAAAFGVL